eukprot:7329740-Alexandrium_andersonii.AAC.1
MGSFEAHHARLCGLAGKVQRVMLAVFKALLKALGDPLRKAQRRAPILCCVVEGGGPQGCKAGEGSWSASGG